MRNCLLAGILLAVGTVATHAADAVIAPQPEIQDQQRWHVIFSPYIWAASLNGTAGLYGYSTDVDIPFRDTLKNLDLTAMGNIEITNGVFGAYFDGQYTKTSQDESLLGHKLGLDVEATNLIGGVYYRLYEQKLEGTTTFGKQRVFAIEPTIGLRWTRLEAKLSSGPYSITRKAEWLDPFIGSRFFYDINDRWNIFAEADIGGFGAGTRLSANGQAYLGYRTFLFDVPTTLRVGYRVLYQDYKNDNIASRFKYDVTQHGPVVGLSMQF
ncbi:hypothetical protein ACFO1V_03630 [Daeguia caeni]|uniref:Outer membrane protein beta-barrel domain-containing protein n=1 Tax=Daeguia caeni TaxID=439612 RepID=A0ABV9H260_9HYPH